MPPFPFLINSILRKIFIIFILIFGWSSLCHAILFERRIRPKPELSYFLYPIAGSIPGVQDFYGIGTTISGISGSDVDITAIHLQGNTEHFSEEFQLNLISILDVPLFTRHLTFSYFYGDIRNGTFPEGERGIDSDRDSIYQLLGEQITFQGGELSYNTYDNQLEFYYGFTKAAVKPFGLIDPNGTFYSAQEAKLAEGPTGYRYGVYLDDTDDRRDPRIGYRVQYEKWEFPSSREGNSAFFQEDYNYTAFIPVLPEQNGRPPQGVLVLNQFFGSSIVTKAGEVDRALFTCPSGAPPNCQKILDELFERQVAEAENGKATSLGGTNRLRGYPTNRFFDSYTNFRGIEFRWYVSEVQQAFDYIVQKGVYAGFQLAFFYEEGTVSPNPEGLFSNFKNSYGLGTRLIFNTVVLRLDQGFSDEGSETTLFVGYPF